jgi:hypothetical protein
LHGKGEWKYIDLAGKAGEPLKVKVRVHVLSAVRFIVPE